MAGEQDTRWEGEEWSVDRKTKSLVSFSGFFFFPFVLMIVLIKSC